MKMSRGERIQIVVLLALALLLVAGMVMLNRARKAAVEQVRQLEDQLARTDELCEDAERLQEGMQEIGSIIDRWRALGEVQDAP